jgi:metacaspase-1
MAGKKALCVGINKFQNLPQGNWLNGCVNDTADMISVLKKYQGFIDNDIVRLIDDQATKKNIMENLTEMVNGAKEGKYDKLVFSISSHGTQVPDLHKDESDLADEAFCPTDIIQKGDIWDPDHVIIDDELHDLFVQLPETVTLECYFDTCHSGTGLKAIDLLLSRKPRLLPPPSLKVFEEVKARWPRSMAISLKEKGLSTRHILWAACRSDQTSADANIGDTWHGAFTYYLCQNINKSQNKLTRQELLTKLRADLKKNKYDQLPQLETNATGRNEKLG